MNVSLVTFRADGQRCDLQMHGAELVLGRHEGCDIQIPHALISRRHARIAQEGSVLRIKDLGSSNGTFVNDLRIVEQILSAGDRLRLADVVFTVVIDGQPAEILREQPPAEVPAETPEAPAAPAEIELKEPVARSTVRPPPLPLTPPPSAAAAEKAPAEDPLSALAAMSRQRNP